MPQAKPRSDWVGRKSSQKANVSDKRKLTRVSNLGARTQEVNEWHCQTGLLLAWSVAENSYLLQANRSFSKPEGLATNPSDAVVAVQYAAQNRDRQECTRTAPERCFPLTAPSAVTIQWCHSGRAGTARSTAVTASVKCGLSLHRASKPS